MRKTLILTFALVLATTTAMAQEAKKPASPPAKATAQFNGKEVTIDYSAPSARGRKIMGELVPYGKVWRTGANAATKLTTGVDLMIGSVHVPAGSYTLYTIPGEKEWTVIINKQTGQWGTKYDEAQDLGRVTVPVKATKAPVETFAINLVPKGNRGTLTLAWENTQVSVPVIAH